MPFAIGLCRGWNSRAYANLSRRLLLRQTVQRTKAKHQIDSMDANYRPIFDQFAKNAQRYAIVGIVKRGEDHRCI